MSQNLRRVWSQMVLLVPAAAGAWLLTLLVGLGAGIANAATRGSSSIGELTAIYVPVMAVPFALSIGIVLLPIIAVGRALVGPVRPWLFGLVGVGTAPVQGLVLLVAGRIVFRQGPHMRPTLWADVAAIADHPADTAALLLAFGVGGAALGVWAARVDESFMGDTPADHALDPTARQSSS